jgi:aspartyl-tRNA(Asn)/glutamyl-tRNA(Gln) amidotransferase subunit A
MHHVPGGSSGGSAAAVKAGLCIAALGSDTGGSVRLPASYCGIVGLKPTYGRISRYGLTAFASSFDQVGVLAQKVEDTALLLDVMAGYDRFDSTSSQQLKTQSFAGLKKDLDWKTIRIGIPNEYFVAGLSLDVEKSIKSSLESFKSRGAQIVPVSLPHTPYSIAVYYIVAVSEASSNLARFDGIRFGARPKTSETSKNLTEFYEQIRSQFGPEVKRRIILGTFALSSGYSDAYYKRACQVRRLIKQDFDNAFKKVDFIMGPVSPSTAFKLGEKVEDPLQMYLNDIYTIPANLAGLPAISLPCGEDSLKLPIGLHVMAPQFEEESLLRLANAVYVDRGA